jgi:hypothetical protein
MTEEISAREKHAIGGYFDDFIYELEGKIGEAKRDAERYSQSAVLLSAWQKHLENILEFVKQEGKDYYL